MRGCSIVRVIREVVRWTPVERVWRVGGGRFGVRVEIQFKRDWVEGIFDGIVLEEDCVCLDFLLEGSWMVTILIVYNLFLDFGEIYN